MKNTNRRGFFGIMSAIAGALGLAKVTEIQKAVELKTGDKPYTPEQLMTPGEIVGPPTPKEHALVSLKNSSFLICPQCGSDMHWARCECGFVWTNRADEVSGQQITPIEGKRPDSLTIVDTPSLRQQENDLNGWENRDKPI